MAALEEESGGDVGANSAAGPSLRPGSEEPLPGPPAGPVPGEANRDGGLEDAPGFDPRRHSPADDAPVPREPASGPRSGAPDGGGESEGDAIHVEDDRV
jgi:hypothetical protein